MPNPEVDVSVSPVVQGPGPREFHLDLLTHPQILILGETHDSATERYRPPLPRAIPGIRFVGDGQVDGI
jgi:hypothetical protein